MTITAAEVVAFWRDAGMEKWFRGGAAFDALCREVLGEAHMAASRRELEAWIEDPEGALALLLLLDQVPRNIFRGSAHSWATDGLARHYAHRAIQAGHDQAFDVSLRAFFYLPFEHSEDLADQDRSVALFEAADDKAFMSYAISHREAIRKFGRFPHRNAALGRANTADEQAWLDAGGGW
ncbi:MAG: DUF924 family protein [Pseudomonadota bacterium]|nr:DUF924 family protein [Pseudomonadota bacterium]